MMFTGVRAQSLNSLAGVFGKGEPHGVNITLARQAIMSEDFDKALYIYGCIIDNQIKDRAQGNQVNNETMAEYAYALALAGAQEAALVNIDLALNLRTPSPVIYFYVNAILDLVGFGSLSGPYTEACRQPAWLDGRGEVLNAKYRSPVLLNITESGDAIRHITNCIKEFRYIEALCYATYLTQIDPSIQAAWLLQSAVWEKLGCYSSALKSYEMGLEQSGESEMPGMEKQLDYLRRKSDKSGNRLATWQMGAMAYGGLTYSNRTTSINGRYGVYSGPLSVSLNMSIGIPKHGDASYYAGLSGYYNIGKLFAGLGLGLQTIGASTTFTLSPTVGLSFVNKRRTSSFDISVAWAVPCRSGVKSTLGISIGKTFYFKTNGNTK